MLIKIDKQDKFLGERKQIISGYWKPDSMSSTPIRDMNDLSDKKSNFKSEWNQIAKSYHW